MTNHTPTLFSIATGSAEPIYRQLVDQVRRLVASSHLAAGDTMPSVRDVAQALAVNPMTVSKAYAMLEAEGLLQRHRGVGMTVAPRTEHQRWLRNKEELLRPALERAAREAKELELDPESALALFARLLKE
ncbi:MAG TPA: GntR family transcriptional regulator [Telluria sp.]|nr:GntR family transcriptional regulator [Telluria sp.]